VKIKKITHKKNYLFAITIIVLAVSAGVAAYIYSSQQKASDNIAKEEKRINTINLDPPTKEEKDTGLDAKKQTLENEDEPSQSSAFTVTLTSANKNGEIFQIRSLISKLSGSGTCELHMVKGSDTITKTANIQAMANSSTCQGFNIPLSELSSGTWKITLTVTIDNTKEQTSKDVEI
jgi:hypothetical protein